MDDAFWRDVVALSQALSIALGKQPPPPAYYQALGHDRQEAEIESDQHRLAKEHAEGLKEAQSHAGSGSWG